MRRVGVIIAGLGANGGVGGGGVSRWAAMCRSGPSGQNEESGADIEFAGSNISYAIVQLANVNKFTIMSPPGFQADFYNTCNSIY